MERRGHRREDDRPRGCLAAWRTGRADDCDPPMTADSETTGRKGDWSRDDWSQA
jgi:hypothetical protein